MPGTSLRTGSFRLSALLLLLASAQAAAETPLHELVQAALSRNPGSELPAAQAAMADALQQRADLPLAGPPTVNLRYQTDQPGSANGYREWEGGVEMPLWLSGQAGSFANEAARYRGVAAAMSVEHEWQTAGEVRLRLWSAALGEAAKTQAQAARDVAQGLAREVRKRVEAGELPRSDLLLAEKDLRLREYELLQADSQSRQAAAVLQRYTGSALSDVSFEETLAQSGPDMQQHPRLHLLKQLVAKARVHRDRVSKNLGDGPSLWLGGKTARDTFAGNYASSVGIEVSVPMGGRTFKATELAEAENALTEARVALMKGVFAVEDELAQARIELDGASVAIGKTRQGLLLAEESLRLSRRAFDLGETGLTPLLRAQNDAIRARNDHDQSQLLHARAIARVNQALGVLPK